MRNKILALAKAQRTQKITQKPMNPLPTDQANLPTPLATVMDRWRTEGKQHWIPVVGDSMLPWLREGDHVLVSHGEPAVRPGEVIVLWQAGRLLIHRIIYIDGDQTHLTFFTKGDHARLFDTPARTGDIIGRVIAIKRNDQQISLGTLTWRILGWLVAITTHANANLLRFGSLIKQRSLGSQPNRLTTFLRQVLSMPFEFALAVLAKLAPRNK